MSASKQAQPEVSGRHQQVVLHTGTCLLRADSVFAMLVVTAEETVAALASQQGCTDVPGILFGLNVLETKY